MQISIKLSKRRSRPLELYKKFIKEDVNEHPKILVHACCAPCSSEVINELYKHGDITIYYYNPNIYPFNEYQKRWEQFSLLPFDFEKINGEYDESIYLDIVNDVKNQKEGSIRCYKCYDFRIKETARYAKENGYDYFTTTLSISPYKNSKWINELGDKYSKEYGVNYIYSDFKKNDGYKKSIILSKENNLYRQEYCGCRYSLKEKEDKIKD